MQANLTPKHGPAAWKAKLTPRQRELAEKWQREAPDDFAAVCAAFCAPAPRGPKPKDSARYPLIVAMARELLRNPGMARNTAAARVERAASTILPPDALRDIPAPGNLAAWIKRNTPSTKSALRDIVQRDDGARMLAYYDRVLASVRAKASQAQAQIERQMAPSLALIDKARADAAAWTRAAAWTQLLELNPETRRATWE